MTTFPMEIITDLLSRLPVKTLLCFRCVSKPWCALIDDKDFVKMHLKRSIQTNCNLTLLLGGISLYSINFDSLDKAFELTHPLKNSGHTDLVNSCNGLILLVGETITLFNPSTRKYRALPDTPVKYPESSVNSVFQTFGFGYDSVDDDYKVVRLMEFKGNDFEWISTEAKVYSLKSNSWRRIKDFPYCLPYKRVWGVHANGALHTVVNQRRDANSPQLIMAFNIGAEEFNLVPQPVFSDKGFDFSVEVMGGCLCLLCAYSGYRTDIWVMKDYGVKESWSKLLSLAPPVVEPYVTVYPLAYSKNKNKVLLNYDDKQLLWYDLKRKSVRRVRVRGLPNPFYIDVCVESLVPLDGFGEIDAVKKQHGQEIRKEKKNRKKRDDFPSKGFKLVL